MGSTILNMLESASTILLLAFFSFPTVVPWCTWAFGESGNGGDRMVGYCPHDTYDANVIEFKEACYARCNCWTDLPSLGGEIYKEVDAVCIMDKCYCVFAEKGYCNHAFLKTDPYCCTPSFWENCDMQFVTQMGTAIMKTHCDH